MRRLFCAIASSVLLVGCAMVGQVRAEVTSYDECVQQGGKILKSFPPQCVTTDGKSFTKLMQKGGETERGCIDRCGDGECQEIVCMAINCPCPESVDSCPRDCTPHPK